MISYFQMKNLKEEDLSEFLDQYQYQDWMLISRFVNLSESFLLNNLENINLFSLKNNWSIPKETIEKVIFMKSFSKSF
jgi:hypothetical protein